MQKMQINSFGALARKRQLVVGAFALSAVASVAGLAYYYYTVVANQTVEPIDVVMPGPAVPPHGMAPMNPMQAGSAPEMAASGAPMVAAGPVGGAVGASVGAAPGPVGPAVAPTAPAVMPASSPTTVAMAAGSTVAGPVGIPVAAPAKPASAPSAPSAPSANAGSQDPSLAAILGRPDESTVRNIGELVRLEVLKSVREAKKEADLAAKALALAEAPPANVNLTSQPGQNATPPAPAKPKVPKTGKLVVPPEPVNTDLVETVSISGRVGQEKAEVSFNGVVITVGKNQRAGSYMVNQIDANCVYLTDRFTRPVNSCILR